MADVQQRIDEAEQTPARSERGYAETATLGMKAISVTGANRAVKALGGRAVDRMTSHRYSIFAMPGSDQYVHVPHPAGRTSGEIGRSHLTTLIGSLMRADVPALFIAHTFDACGAMWHQPPEGRKPKAWALNLLREHKDLVEAGDWEALMYLANPAEYPYGEENNHAAQQRLKDREERLRVQRMQEEIMAAANTPEYLEDFHLRDAVHMGLPEDPDEKIASKALRSVSRLIGFAQKEPWKGLVAREEITREKVTKAGAYEYQITEGAAQVIAREARAYYDAHMNPIDEKPGTEPKVAHETTDDDGYKRLGIATEFDSRLFGEFHDPRPEDQLRFDEALTVLCQRFGVYPKFHTIDGHLTLRVKSLIEELERASRSAEMQYESTPADE